MTVGRVTIALAGAGGDLGGRIAKALVARGAAVRALVRPDAGDDECKRIAGYGAILSAADPTNVEATATAVEGASCVVSALNGVRRVIIDRQEVLLDAAIAAAVPRFIPSDYSADFTNSRPGDNRNFDLRREFMARLDAAPIKATSILNGAFMNMLGREMPIIQPAIRRVLYWSDRDQLLDFTKKDDVAAYVAAAATDAKSPRILRIAGDSVSARDIARIMTNVSGEHYHTLWAGSLPMLGAMIGITKRIVGGEDEPFPPWQGMQYMRDQFSGRGKLAPLDNGRYPDLQWTNVEEHMHSRAAATRPAYLND